MVGADYIGKTALLNKYQNLSMFTEATIGAYSTRLAIRSEGKYVQTIIWYPQGKEEFLEQIPDFGRTARIGVLMFALNHRESWYSVLHYVYEFGCEFDIPRLILV